MYAPRVDLESVRLLIRVVEAGSVHGAARQLGLSRSLLRRRLDALESELGCELFVANATGVVLTTAGAIVARDGRELLERSARMVSSAKDATTRAEGVLRIVVHVGMPDVVRSQLFGALRATSPGLRIHEYEASDPLAHLGEPFDLMFHLGPAPTHGEWFSRALRVHRLVPIASSEYLADHGTPTTTDDLGDHALLSWRRPGSDPMAWPLRRGGTLSVAPVLVSDNANLLHRAAQQGLGILLGSPDPAMLPEATPLVPVLEELIATEETIRVLSSLRVQADPRMRAVLEGIEAFLALG